MHECEICGNTFETESLNKERQDHNYFGYEYCPFCGTQYDATDTDDKPLTQPAN